jgi:nitrite reductase/ring-hydroxylating ferredoxin subunit/alkylhydroperoxidase/carboxymuconolactone decarboxylase family protein YurZ
MSEFVEVGQLDQIPPGVSSFAQVGDKRIALFNVAGQIYAIDDVCAHAGQSLAQGKLAGKVVTCRAHGWRYDVTTGNLTTVPDFGVASYPVKVADGKILVALKQATVTGDSKVATPNKAETESVPSAGPWDSPALSKLREWEPAWADQCLNMSRDPWINGILPHKEIELISLAVNAACTNLSEGGTRRHIRAALEAGATRDEVLMTIKVASLLSLHTCSLGAPILLEEAKAAGVKLTPKKATTPVCDKMKAAGQWNKAWDEFFEIDPAWTEAIISVSLPVYTSGVFPPKLAELISIAVDASITHMYAPGTRRHIQSALKLGATVEEIMEVLKICVAAGMQASNLGIPILADELERLEKES